MKKEKKKRRSALRTLLAKEGRIISKLRKEARIMTINKAMGEGRGGVYHKYHRGSLSKREIHEE